MLSIRLLGAAEVSRNGEYLSIKRRKSRALLYYLAAHEQPVSRSRLLTLLWADHAPHTARSNLRSTLYTLRVEIDPHLAVDADSIYLAGDVEVDVRRFAAMRFDGASAAIPSAQALAALLALYRGDFLADLDLSDTPEYEEWVVLERERLQRKAIRGFDVLAHLYLQEGAVQPALTAIEEALALDPFQEDLQRTALHLHHQAGDRAGAIRRFEEFRRLLDAEMGVPPLAETQMLYDAIITDNPLPDAARATSLPAAAHPPAPDTAPQSPPAKAQPATPPIVQAHRDSSTLSFIGRQAELEQLVAWHDDRRLVLVEGESGIGKTRLLEHFLETYPARDALILRGRARELESRLPYQPIIEALRSAVQHPAWSQWQAALEIAPLWQAEIARLVPELLPNRPLDNIAPKDADASRLWESVYQWLAALARHRHIYLLLDDLHWADAASLGLLGYVTRRMAGGTEPVYLLATGGNAPGAPRTRTDSAALLQTLLREDLLHRLTLQSLSQRDVVKLAQSLSSQYGHPLGAWLYRSSEGNPFVLTHLLRYAREDGLLDEHGTVNIHRLPTAPVVPQTVYTLIQTRLESLSESARRILDAAVVVGREFDFEVVARAAALSDTAALDALDELRQARLIQSTNGDRFAFDHTLTREVACREVGEVRHRLLHRRVAAALESLYPNRLDEVAGLLAHHYSEGNLPEQAHTYALRAGHRAAAMAAWQPAIGFFQQALATAPTTPDTPETNRARLTLMATLGDAYLHAGEIPKATEILYDAVTQSKALAAHSILRTALQSLAEALLNQARYAEAITLAKTMLDVDDPHVRFVVDYMWAAGLALEGIDLETATARLLAAEARVMGATDADSQVRLAQIAFELGGIDAQQGRLDQAIARYRQTLELTASLQTDESLRWHIMANNNLGYHLHLIGNPDAITYAQQGYTLARERGSLGMTAYLLSTLGEIALAGGDPIQAEHYFAQGLAHAHRLNQPERIAGLTANLGLAALARRQPEQAIDRLTTALELAEVVPSRYLIAQIHLWLAPLLPTEQADSHLEAAHAIAIASGYSRLYAQWQQLTGAPHK